MYRLRNGRESGQFFLVKLNKNTYLPTSNIWCFCRWILPPLDTAQNGLPQESPRAEYRVWDPCFVGLVGWYNIDDYCEYLTKCNWLYYPCLKFILHMDTWNNWYGLVLTKLKTPGSTLRHVIYTGGEKWRTIKTIKSENPSFYLKDKYRNLVKWSRLYWTNTATKMFQKQSSICPRVAKRWTWCRNGRRGDKVDNLKDEMWKPLVTSMQVKRDMFEYQDPTMH